MQYLYVNILDSIKTTTLNAVSCIQIKKIKLNFCEL